MAQKSETRRPSNRQASAANQAYGAAKVFWDNFATLAWHARSGGSAPKDLAGTFAFAFVSWFDLTQLLTAPIRDAAKAVYPPGAAPIRFGPFRAKTTVIEAVTDEVGVFFRNLLYQDRRCPLDPNTELVRKEAKARATARNRSQGRPATPLGWEAEDRELIERETVVAVRLRLGIKTWADRLMLIVEEWNAQTQEQLHRTLKRLRLESLDLEEVKALLDREARAVLALERERAIKDTRDLRSAAWFKRVTNMVIDFDRLRRARLDGRLNGKLVGGRWQYSRTEVAAIWPEFAECIEGAA